MPKVKVEPLMLRWALERAGPDRERLERRFPKIQAWEDGEVRPTLKQLESFAKTVHVPIGYLFLPEPPDEPIPISDFRTIGNRGLPRPSPDLLDTIYSCQRRQDWYRDFALSEREEPRGFVGSADIKDDVEETASRMREEMGFDLEARRGLSTWEDAFRQFIGQADEIGVLVMVNGVVGNDTHRKLDPEEFRGFAMVDNFAPLVFINGADTKAAQIFTLAHELAHLWLGESALSDSGLSSVPEREVERWCNRVAAELLVPLEELRQALSSEEPLEAVSDLARRFKVSTLVILRRLLDAGAVSRAEFDKAYEDKMKQLRGVLARRRKASGGGNFYSTEERRVGSRFARALIGSTLEGHTLYRDAFKMLDIKSTKTFLSLGGRLGYPV